MPSVQMPSVRMLQFYKFTLIVMVGTAAYVLLVPSFREPRPALAWPAISGPARIRIDDCARHRELAECLNDARLTREWILHCSGGRRFRNSCWNRAADYYLKDGSE